MYNNNKIIRRYSESFKLKVLSELSNGNYTKNKLAKIYGMNPSTINEWIKKYDRKDLMNSRVMIETKDEISRLKALKKEVSQLKDLLIKKDLDKLVTDSYLEVAAENLGYKNVQEFKKKLKHLALMKTVKKTRQTGQENISEVCILFDLKRDAYYKYLKRYEVRKTQETKVIEMVDTKRKVLPRVGCRKLLSHLEVDFKNANLKIGRDKLFNILRANNRLIKPRRASCRTTNSYHHFHKYNNLIKDFTPTKINQVWVTDITYIRTVNGFCYLALVTDLYSRKIVGFDTS